MKHEKLMTLLWSCVLSFLLSFGAVACVVSGFSMMVDLGDLREGFWNRDEFVSACVYVEKNLPHVHLAGIGVNLGCYGSIQPTPDKMNNLLTIAHHVEARIGRSLEVISGGASSSYTLVHWGTMPEGINHLRLGGSIANPMNIRLGRGLTFPGLREDSLRLTAEIVEIHEKASAPKGQSTKNWAGETVTREDKGRRWRAILALGSQDVGDAGTLIPVDDGVEIVGCSSDHTIVDVTDSGRVWKTGDTLIFKTRYANMLYAFSGKHMDVTYVYDAE